MHDARAYCTSAIANTLRGSGFPSVVVAMNIRWPSLFCCAAAALPLRSLIAESASVANQLHCRRVKQGDRPRP